MGTDLNKHHPNPHLGIRRMENDQRRHNPDTEHLQRSTQGDPTTTTRNPHHYPANRNWVPAHRNYNKQKETEPPQQNPGKTNRKTYAKSNRKTQ